MDFLDEFFSEPSVEAPVASRFQPKLKARAKKGPSTAVHISSNKEEVDQPVEASAPVASSIENEKEIPAFPDVSFTSSSPFRPFNSQTDDHTMPSTYQDSFQDSGDFQIDVEQLEAGDFSCLDAVEMMGKKAVKFRPKPKVQTVREEDLVQAVSHFPDSPQPPPEDEHVTEHDSVHTEEPDTVSDLSHVRLDDNFMFDPTMHESDTVVCKDTDSLMATDAPEQACQSGKHWKRLNVATSSDTAPDGGPVSSGTEANENGYEFSGGIGDDFHGNSSSPTRGPGESASNRDENNIGDHMGEEISQKKRGRKSKKVASENDKPTKKRKKPSQELEQSTDKPPKKFPRATQRKRCVNKSLLEAPEDELDLQRVPIRDLIILAEYKERQAKKGAAAVQPPLTNERTDGTQLEDPPYDDDTNGFDQDRYPSTSRIQKDTGYYNYHTHMERKRRVKWSKQDTELFYQGIQQFGTDFGMIQQLFPHLERDHIKLKYKKEERQNPMMLHDALTSRTKDLSHFELVIERLQEQAAREEEEREQQGSDGDDSVQPMGEEGEPEENRETHATSPEAAAKAEQDEAAGEESDKPQVGAPAKSYDEDDLDWMFDYTPL